MGMCYTMTCTIYKPDTRCQCAARGCSACANERGLCIAHSQWYQQTPSSWYCREFGNFQQWTSADIAAFLASIGL